MTFEDLLQGWVDAACEEWGYPKTSADRLAGIPDRVPPGLRTLITTGHHKGLITTTGLRFTLRGLPAGKGPYAWLSKDKRQVPTINWEYLVQAAEYVRIHDQLTPLGYRILVEDRLMDITVERDAHLLWYIEVKERADELPDLATKIAEYGAAGVDLDLTDRGNDALQKAKYLVRYRPDYFTLTAIGMTLSYGMTYGESMTFRLLPDVVPLA